MDCHARAGAVSGRSSKSAACQHRIGRQRWPRSFEQFFRFYMECWAVTLPL
jgi:hypothetical protein